MSKYPRTDAARLKDVCRHMAMAEECTRMEYELNEAKARIKRLEQAGDELLEWLKDGTISDSNYRLLANAWQRAKKNKR